MLGVSVYSWGTKLANLGIWVSEEGYGPCYGKGKAKECVKARKCERNHVVVAAGSQVMEMLSHKEIFQGALVF